MVLNGGWYGMVIMTMRRNNSQIVRVASAPYRPNAKSSSAHKGKQKLNTVDDILVKIRRTPIMGYCL
ncbi:hypothetical protein GOBAR_AA17230 [Gossypium barbadense]|uniref:Uncharacterized protein n=1 Tax=Gossypium barbadense TaxID=3634 RepID=A0A2P5XJD3_GOSBA|nr:hypothetical protein GOBAR_AA17230 [Gossypium barbadense]